MGSRVVYFDSVVVRMLNS